MNTRQAIIDKVNEVVALARVKFPNYTHPAPAVTFYNAGTSAGKAKGVYQVSFNLSVFEQDLQRFLDTTVPHEIAHTVCFALGIDRGHGRNWKAVCLALGGDGKRCFDGAQLTIVNARSVKVYRHIATCGLVLDVSSTIHKRVMAGQVRTVRKTGGSITKATFTGIVL